MNDTEMAVDTTLDATSTSNIHTLSTELAFDGRTVPMPAPLNSKPPAYRLKSYSLTPLTAELNVAVNVITCSDVDTPLIAPTDDVIVGVGGVQVNAYEPLASRALFGGDTPAAASSMSKYNVIPDRAVLSSTTCNTHADNTPDTLTSDTDSDTPVSVQPPPHVNDDTVTPVTGAGTNGTTPSRENVAVMSHTFVSTDEPSTPTLDVNTGVGG